MMVWPHEKLRMIARDTAEKLDAQRAGLQAAFHKLKAELDIANRALDRADSYVPELDGKPQCPECYVKTGRNSELTRIEDTARTDNYRCSTCKTTFALAY
jgi:hypothetical protein